MEDLINLKYVLNKLAKIPDIEHYEYPTVLDIFKKYSDMLKKSKGVDPDFPGMKLKF